jgi:hypothetical protein
MNNVFKRINPNLSVFLTVIFALGFIYQPNWAYENFWSRADFYESIPFAVPFIVFKLVFASAQTGFAWICIKLIKKYL